MKLSIEKWVEEKGFSKKVSVLFDEAVICYKNQAYRASLLYSYLGFLTIIKGVMLKAKKPSYFEDGEWDVRLRNIRNDRIWEEEIFKSLMKKGDKPVFPISESLRLEINYWKDRRNDCAHFKDNEITGSHTENFWSFLMSNLSKITVEGGKSNLLNKFDEHFDDIKTPQGSDYSHLVKEISASVTVKELHDFFRDLEHILHRRYYHNSYDVFASILDLSEQYVKEELIDFYKKDNPYDIIFLENHPNKIDYFNFSQKEVRELWKSRLFQKYLRVNYFTIISTLLKRNLIPSSEISEVNELMFDKFNQSSNHFLPHEEDIPILRKSGFFKLIYEIAFNQKNLQDYLWVNSKCDLIVLYVNVTPLNKDIVSKICSMAAYRNPSQWLLRELKRDFEFDNNLKNEFHRIANKENFIIPHELK